EFLWKDMPGNRIPDNYTQTGIDRARLSSKSHWDVPIRVGAETVHLLASHPTPPVFDDAVFDENGRRNADEIRFWGDYIDPDASDYIYDDAGRFGGLADGSRFVIVGDQNADPLDGDSFPGALDPLVANPRINNTQIPASAGGVEDAAIEGGPNDQHQGDPAWDTADFGSPGNLRVDYVLPSANLTIAESGVFWPTREQAYRSLVSTSDHQLVYVDVVVPEPASGVYAVTALLMCVLCGLGRENR
ncbi:MAG: endonuclease/exonuclease/phosphatase family protein, partial [Pirellulales bacterium]